MIVIGISTITMWERSKAQLQIQGEQVAGVGGSVNGQLLKGHQGEGSSC